MRDRLRIFTDRKFVPSNAPHCEMLYPFWGLVEEKAFWRSDRRFDKYLINGPSTFELTADPTEADVHLLPADWGYYLLSGEMDLVEKMSRNAESAGKSLLVFFRDDRECTTNLSNSIEICTSLERSKRRRNQHALVAWTGDFVKTYLEGKLPVRKKQGKPVVGFCGQTFWDKTVWSKAKSFLRKIRHPLRTRKFEFLNMRYNVLNTLDRSDLVETNFLPRNSWYGGKQNAGGNGMGENVLKSRFEYVNNLVNCDYVVTIRGAGNYSFRFYESLACGRIPLFIDTDCVLPFENDIDWSEYCIWLDYKNFRHVDEAVADFHCSISESRFIELQHECRRLYEDWVSPDGFFRKMGKKLLSELN